MSKYISKQQSSNVAKTLTQKLTDQIKLKESEISAIVSEIYIKTLPKDIAEIYKYFKRYFHTASQIRCEGNGLNDSFKINESVPSQGGWQVCILPTASEAKKISKISNEIKKIETKRDNLKNSIENTLNSLRTYNRIQKEFPEAFEILPDKDPTINTLAVPIDDIRAQLEAIK